jgi:hypothetical protein
LYFLYFSFFQFSLSSLRVCSIWLNVFTMQLSRLKVKNRKNMNKWYKKCLIELTPRLIHTKIKWSPKPGTRYTDTRLVQVTDATNSETGCASSGRTSSDVWAICWTVTCSVDTGWWIAYAILCFFDQNVHKR